MPGKRVAIIGLGPSGAISIDALVKENSFSVIRAFERREAAGGCWIGDSGRPPTLKNFASLASRTADVPIPIPECFPAQTPKVDGERFAESSIYPYLETNVVTEAMQFSQEPISEQRTEASVALYGSSTPYRHWSTMRQYVQDLVNRNGYQDLVSYNTTVEKAEKIDDEWKLVLRKSGEVTDTWWTEYFDAVIVASGHWHVPYVPSIPGLEDFEKSRPGSVLHSKHFRGREQFRGKRVVVVGASVSGADISVDLTAVAEKPIHAIVVGRKPNVYFGDAAFSHPGIQRHPSIEQVVGRSVRLVNGHVIKDVDHIIFGTGYSWTLPFLPQVEIRNNRVPKLYQHIVWRDDPTLLFVGAVGAGLTFKIFEWQAVFAARLLAGRTTLPSVQEMKAWEEARIAKRGDGPKFTLVHPDFEDYFEGLRKLAGEGVQGSRKLPKFRREWFRDFMDGHELRINMWKRLIKEALPYASGSDARLARL